MEKEKESNITKGLEKLGLSPNESKIYLILLENEKLTAGEVSKKIKIHRRSIYDILNNLTEKGLLGYNILEKKKYFFAVNFKNMIDDLIKVQQSVLQDISQITKTPETSRDGEKVLIYKGSQGVKNILNLILESQEFYIMSPATIFLEILGNHIWFFREMSKKKEIKGKFILNDAVRKLGIFLGILNNIPKGIKIKFFKHKVRWSSTTFLFEDKVAIITWEKPYTSILINDKDTYNSYLDYFNFMWGKLGASYPPKSRNNKS